MGFLRRIFGFWKRPPADPAVNPRRTRDLYALTPEGYIIAQDIACQYEFARDIARCPYCDGTLRIAAQLNRASQGLNELVCMCTACNRRTSLIFDVSNDVYQRWIASQMGDLYLRNYDGPARRPAR